MRFILDLVQLNVESLLIICENNEDDLKVVKDFKEFLHIYSSKHNIGAKIPPHFQKIQVSLHVVLYDLYIYIYIYIYTYF